MFYSSFWYQSYQNNSYQIGNDNEELTGGGYVYNSPSSRHEQEKREQIARQKTDLQKADSVLEEYKRKLELVKLAKLEAKRKAALRLAAQELEYVTEINRLLQVRALLLQRIRQNEEALIVLLMMRRRRLRIA